MDTTERMMIMGMCLQGLLANSSRTSINISVDGVLRQANEAELLAQRQANVREAHQYADLLDPPPEVSDAQRILAISRVAYEAVRAADADNAGKWVHFDDARTSDLDTHLDRAEGVIERVSRWFKDPVGMTETYQDRIIRAVTLASVDSL